MTSLSPYQKAILHEAAQGTNLAINAKAGTGKAQPLSEPILTPHGWVTMGDIHVGDNIIGIDGKAYPVIAVHPQGELDVYRVEFTDGSYVRCNSSHLWTVQTLHDRTMTRKKGILIHRVLPLEDIYKDYLRENAKMPYKYHVPSLLSPVVQGEEVKEAYLEGYMLGNGCVGGRMMTITSPDDQFLKHTDCKPTGYFQAKGCRQYRFSWKSLPHNISRYRGATLSGDKRLLSNLCDYSVNSRLELLRGLIDADGTNQNQDGRDRLSFSSTSIDLLHLVRDLVRSLGGRACEPIWDYRDSYKTGRCGKVAFRLPFKASYRSNKTRTTLKKYSYGSAICSITLEGKESQQCITVDAPLSLYVTRGFKLTHNSHILEHISKQTTKRCLVLAFNKHNAIEIDGKIRGDCRTMHSLGMGILTKFAPTKVNRNKIIPLARMFKIPVKKRLEFEIFWNVYRLSAAHPNSDHWKSIVQDFCTFRVDSYYEQAEALEEANMSLWLNDGLIDFVDMLWIPARLPSISPVKYDLVAIDECFPGETKIITSTGKRKIRAIYNDVQKGKPVMVKSLNEHTNEFEWKPVTKAWNRGAKDIYEVVIGGKTRLKATLNHPILTSTGWKHFGKLAKGDAVITSDTTEPSSRFIKGDLEDLMLGTSLGDGYIQRVSQNKVRLTIGTHGMPQYEYCKWKADAFQVEVVLVEKNGFSQKPACRATTKTFYCEYPDDLSRIEALTLKSLAVLYMDDGNLRSSDAINLYACAPDKHLTEAIQRQIYRLTREAGVVKTQQSSSTGNDYHLISYTKESSRKILELIAPFIHPTMKYKLPSDLQHLAGTYSWSFTYPPLGCRIVNSAPTYHSTQDAYDLEVADNHNFLVGSSTRSGRKTWDGIVVHNCQDISPIGLDLISNVTTPKTQIIVAGDSEQKIYGSLNMLHYENLEEAKRRWDCKELSLPISYRCPSEVIKEANVYVPEIQYYREGGAVEPVLTLPKNIPSGSLVLSGHYAFLMPEFIERRLAGEKVALRGHNFIEECLKEARKSAEFPHKKSFSYLVAGAKEKLAKKMAKCSFTIAGMDERRRLDSVRTTLDTMDASFSTLKEAESFAGGVNKLAGADYVFSSIHRCKGSESDNVYFLGYNDYAEKSADDLDVRRLTYVGVTRSKNNLVLVR